MAMMVVGILGACETKTGDGQAPAEAAATTATEAPAPQDTYAPDGLDGATVTIKPLGKA